MDLERHECRGSWPRFLELSVFGARACVVQPRWEPPSRSRQLVQLKKSSYNNGPALPWGQKRHTGLKPLELIRLGRGI